jgi:Ca2+-binding RTX toxin-like protein
MTSFTISTNVLSGQSLVTGDFGLIAASGSILSPVGSAVTMAGNATLIAYGALAATTGAALTLSSVSATSVTVATTGSVIAGGIDLAAVEGGFFGNFSLANAGLISGGRAIALSALSGASQLNLGNTGTLQGLGNSDGAALSLALNQTSRAILTNSGTLATAGSGATIAVTGNGNVTLTNTGHLLNASALESAIDVAGGLTLRNSGLIEGNVVATLSANIFNAGTIDGNIRLNSYNDVVRISGTVMGDIQLGNGINIFWQVGGRIMGTVYGGAGDDSYHVDRSDTVIVDTSGGLDWVYASCSFRLPAGVEKLTLIGVGAYLGQGNALNNTIIGDGGDETLRGAAGGDYIDAGAGNNRVFGGIGADTLRSGDGDDLLSGGLGNDLLYVGYGSDTINGNVGSDTLAFDLITDPNGVLANLGTKTFAFADAGALSVREVENMSGTSQNDRLTGDGGGNVLMGNGGTDMLAGAPGNDTLIGGMKADTLYGGLDSDVFLYTAVTESCASFGIDRIADFVQGADLVSLEAIDATPGGSDDAFTWLGTGAFTGAGPEIRTYQSGGLTYIEARLDGSTSDDLEISFAGLIALTAADFLL